MSFLIPLSISQLFLSLAVAAKHETKKKKGKNKGKRENGNRLYIASDWLTTTDKSRGAAYCNTNLILRDPQWNNFFASLIDPARILFYTSIPVRLFSAIIPSANSAPR